MPDDNKQAAQMEGFQQSGHMWEGTCNAALWVHALA